MKMPKMSTSTISVSIPQPGVFEYTVLLKTRTTRDKMRRKTKIPCPHEVSPNHSCKMK